MRRKVSVGVAYGPGIELVRKTLFEIADQVRNVYKNPKPDVLFDKPWRQRTNIYTVLQRPSLTITLYHFGRYSFCH